MKKIYFVRHGETDLNASRTHQPPDSNLSELGISQAEIVGERLKDLLIETIIASPHSRTKHTAEIIADTLNLPIIYHQDIVETRRPTAVLGVAYDNPDAKATMKQIRDNRHDPNYHHSDEENIFDSFKRAKNFVNFLTTLPEQKILVVTHGEILRLVIWAAIFGEEFDPNFYDKWFWHTKTTNTGITVLELNENGWRLITWNDYSHLP